MASAKTKNPGGRPSKLTDNLITDIVERLKVCLHIETACASMGIHKETYYAWLRTAALMRDKPPKRPTPHQKLCLEFSDSVAKGLAEAEVLDQGIILRAAQAGAWQASQTRLERRHPDRYARPGHVTVKGDSENPLRLSVTVQEIDYSDAIGEQ